MAYAIYVFIINKFMTYVNNFANFSFDEAKIIMSPVFFYQVTSFDRNQSRTSKHLHASFGVYKKIAHTSDQTDRTRRQTCFTLFLLTIQLVFFARFSLFLIGFALAAFCLAVSHSSHISRGRRLHTRFFEHSGPCPQAPFYVP